MGSDNILDSDCTALVNATNTLGVMGAGLAAQFAHRYPDMLRDYEATCRAGYHKVGEVMFYHDASGKIIVNFPTMEFPGSRAELDHIEAGLAHLRNQIIMAHISRSANAFDSLAVPALGCGVGRLKWADVEALIHKYLGDLTIRVDVYPPTGRKYTL